MIILPREPITNKATNLVRTTLADIGLLGRTSGSPTLQDGSFINPTEGTVVVLEKTLAKNYDTPI